jgi:hypothetical protein
MGLREQLAARKMKLEAGQDPGEFNPNKEPEVEIEEDIPAEEEAPEVEESEENSSDQGEKDEKPAEETDEKVEEEKPEDAEKPAEEIAAAAPEAEKFVADFKYRADGKDLEVPEFLRPLIKDKASQDQIVTMLKKHDAFDTVSARRDQFKNERDVERSEKQKYAGAIDDMRATYQRGDIDGFLKKCEISEESMLKWATEKAKYLMGDDAYRAQVDQQNKLRQDAWKNESQANTYQTQFQELEAKQLQTEFNYEMLKPEVSSFADSFDKFAGKQGAFIEEVKNRGELAYLREKKTISPGEVIQAIMKQFGSIAQAPQKVQVEPPKNVVIPKVVVKPAPKVATIPTVKGTQASPTKEGFTSMDKLRQYRKDTYGK